MKIPANQLPIQLKKNLLPCYLVSGDEPLLVQEALDAIRAAARAAGFATRDLFIAERGFDWNEFGAAGGNLSLFSERRIIELRLPTGKPGKEGGAAIANMVKQLDKDLLLIVIAPKLDKRTTSSGWAGAVSAAGAQVEVWPVDRRELPAWLQSRMQAIGLQPDRDAVRLIADRVENNLLAAQQEIEKLRLLLGEGKVTAEHVQRAVADSSRFDVYKLVDAALAGDARRALRILHGVQAEGVDAVIVMWALTREVRTLVRLADYTEARVDLSAAMRKCGVWQNRQSLVRACVGRHRRSDFYRLLKALRLADAASKGQMAGDPWQLATEIIVALAAGELAAA
ncbi:MAG: DNA polymerase III subunit delta [Woeseia sp.]